MTHFERARTILVQAGLRVLRILRVALECVEFGLTLWHPSPHQWWIRQDDGVKRSPSMREARIRLLSEELDRLRASAVERSRSIDTKASFVVVAAGVLATGAFASLLSAKRGFSRISRSV